MKPVIEKRKHNRIEFQKSVQVFQVLPSKSGNIFEVQNNCDAAWANDISEGGLRLETSKFFDPSLLLKLNFEVEEDQSVEVYGKVIWAQDHHCGVRFMMVDQKMRKGIRSITRKKDFPAE